MSRMNYAHRLHEKLNLLRGYQLVINTIDGQEIRGVLKSVFDNYIEVTVTATKSKYIVITKIVSFMEVGDEPSD